ncbi:hypothetical protein STRCI_000036 [Streptomyces cinnabarinus]|uniref:Uncharacterized protein n=1 Tax=Streptomyces cinnabarinus TaxID=67287 RepID=A0ABY7K6X7_9ACTN|nr:hypothetical protein [Streptomyces cinnabarinus]WAZ19017.1 hypothetical protein STRCI_000036 [Streptomyces cinnabarinus]
MSTSTGENFAESDIDNAVEFMKFLAKNDLWDEIKETLRVAGITEVRVSAEPVREIRKMISTQVMPGDRLSRQERIHALVIEECGCGGSPGPGHGPVSPSGGGDGGADGGHPQ